MPASQETMPPQIANLLGSQDVAPVQRQEQQQSGLPSGRDLGLSQQRQGSHDSASNQPQHMSIGFAATGEVPNTSVNAATVQQGQTGMNPFPPPLDKTRFEQAFRAYCVKKNLNVNIRKLQIDNRPVDLYRLHRNVMLEFGVSKIFLKVEQKALWDVIGGRMGFVQFYGTETEPAKSGPGVAQQLAHIYKELLAAFDHYYISAVAEAQLKAQAQTPRNPLQMSPQLMQSVLTYAHMSVSELHQRGVLEKIITFVEANRANLQRTYADQKSFQSRFRLTNQTRLSSTVILYSRLCLLFIINMLLSLLI
ncbi:uncharacterized protein LACBIDRAFT_297375 [Laccaria bicolor S238N-H82]|uniref:Predicted protein n=1 Tax=Laccaria bicolor (strain S238N-H82 / ATCC MYA-4686) TaxID=486041 RepID=B0DAM5_LACBS|nr:uncharacterized protein LACBIDRAFT_297375 [Laccaria bicolor S238N-H82]EDR08560.1 predicted protein [Laccaria bicolor S238N-H82]|eukprot:XP_001880785.1 predicted protein [Laccaria bicolor S238N-H82]